MKVRFKGFDGEDLEVRIIKHGKHKYNHHHLEVYHNGRKLWYAHLWDDAISLWDGSFHEHGEAKNNIYIELGGD